jgi:hypothetical protein
MTPPDSEIRAYFEAQGWTISHEQRTNGTNQERYAMMFCKQGKRIPFHTLAQAWRRIGP